MEDGMGDVRHPQGNEPRKPTTGAVPGSWLAITGMLTAEAHLELLRRVDELGVAHDDLDAVRRVWQQMSDT